jgi:hypothetical protein
MGREFRQAPRRFRPQRRRIARDDFLAGLFAARDAPVQRRDQLLELTNQFGRVYRHRWSRLGVLPRRAAFQISPQPPQRQYAFSSGLRDVVVIADDLHAGHTAGGASGSAARDRGALPFP